ncbi:hypothetical protein Lepto7375DRAFT_1563 [Leptolyngbya sp. PCC 7375]|nr:hypothetical protein Lepto7375DRAFT_1563 [Leptolyngbya sp. PCC 7375]
MGTRIIRLALGFLAPPALVAISYIVLNTWQSSFHVGLAIGWLTFYAGLRYAGIQLLAYSLLMEFLVVPKLKNIYTVTFVSGLLLLLTVISAFMRFFGPHLAPFENDRLTPVLGFVIGSLLGYGLKLSAQRQRKRG